MTDNNALAQPDWTQIAKAAGEHGVRYRTNSALLAFLAEIHTPAPVAGEVGERPVSVMMKDVAKKLREYADGSAPNSWRAGIERQAADMLERLAGPVQGVGKPKYPDDGGLREQVRPLGESFNGFQMIREHFGLGEPVQQAGGDQVERTLKRNIEGWDNAIELGLLPPQHHWCAHVLADENRAALAAMQTKENNP